jgi:hypothetical protein|uniref:Methyltransferase n=1 Tax=viral metagenome TaxID=1070528 RepID=A0A6C0BG68_9ZZZZ
MQKHSIHLGNYHVPQNAVNGVCVDIGGNTGQFSIKYNDFLKLYMCMNHKKNVMK